MSTPYKLSGPKGAASQKKVRGPFLAMASMLLLTGVAIAAAGFRRTTFTCRDQHIVGLEWGGRCRRCRRRI